MAQLTNLGRTKAAIRNRVVLDELLLPMRVRFAENTGKDRLMRKRNNTTTNLLQMIVGCSGAGISANAAQIGTDPTLTLILESHDGQHYLLPLSEPGVTALQQVLPTGG